MIARELLDRGIAKRLAVICAPHLCDQWAQELSEKFNIETAVIQPSRIARLERDLPRNDISIYRHYRHLVGTATNQPSVLGLVENLTSFLSSVYWQRSCSNN